MCGVFVCVCWYGLEFTWRLNVLRELGKYLGTLLVLVRVFVDKVFHWQAHMEKIRHARQPASHKLFYGPGVLYDKHCGLIGGMQLKSAPCRLIHFLGMLARTSELVGQMLFGKECIKSQHV